MKLAYTVTADDRRQARRIYESALTPARWLTGMAAPISFLSLGYGIYCYAIGNRPLAFSLFAGFGYLFCKKFLFRYLVDFITSRRKPDPEHFQFETSDSGIIISPLGSTTPSNNVTPLQKSWSEFGAYTQTPDMFVIACERTYYVIPKSSLTAAEISDLAAILSTKLSQATMRTGVRALRHTVALVLLGYIGFFFFGGTFERAVFWVVQPLVHRKSFRSSAAVPLPTPASLDQLHGFGEIYLVPIGNTSQLFSTSLIEYYWHKYGISLHVLPGIAIPEWARDEGQHQVAAEELIEAMRRAYPHVAQAPDNILIGVTDEDMYISDLDWKFSLNLREGTHALVISTARLNPVYYGEPPNLSLLEARLRKLLTKNIGVTFYGLNLTGNRGSVLYNDIQNVETLDAMGEDYSIRDAMVGRDNSDAEGGDPCFVVRHYYSAKKQRRDSANLIGGCSSTHGETDLEVLEIYLRFGLLLSRRTDFYSPRPLPLELSRVIRTQDSRSRAFGIGGNHSLNIFPVGNTWPSTWMDIIFENGGRLHFRRSNWGASYWDAIFVAEKNISDFYSSYVTWNWPGWKLTRQDGKTYFFADGGVNKRPEQEALIGVQDADGHVLRLQRESTGNLVVASSGSESVRFNYDPQYRVKEAQDNAGHEVKYGYGETGCLETVEDAEHHVTQYGHDGTRCPTSMSIDGRPVWSAQFDKADRVTQLDVADAGTYKFAYSTDRSGSITQVDIKDAANNVVRITYEHSGYRLEHIANGNTSLALR